MFLLSKALRNITKNLNEFGELAHEFVVVLHPACGVNQHHVHVLLLAVRNRKLGHLSGILQITLNEHHTRASSRVSGTRKMSIHQPDNPLCVLVHECVLNLPKK